MIEFYILIISLVLAFCAQAYVSSTYKRFTRINVRKDLTGAEVAKKILETNGLNDVHVVETSGFLSDHYDPSRKTVRLSTHNFRESSISAISVAAHEVGHAIQDKKGDFFLKIRASLVPLVNFTSKISYIAILAGLILGFFELFTIGVGLMLFLVAFQLVTLPVEFGASKIAIFELEKASILEGNEKRQAKSVLNAAALTYVAALAVTILQMIRLILMANRR